MLPAVGAIASLVNDIFDSVGAPVISIFDVGFDVEGCSALVKMGEGWLDSVSDELTDGIFVWEEDGLTRTFVSNNVLGAEVTSLVEGALVGTKAGKMLASIVGDDAEGSSVGCDVIVAIGFSVAFAVGCDVGCDIGFAVGCDVGCNAGCDVGCDVGCDTGGTLGASVAVKEGPEEAVTEELSLASTLGATDVVTLGALECSAEGAEVGDTLGPFEGSSRDTKIAQL